MMYTFLFLLFSFGALYFGRTFCIYMGCTDIEYCMYDICDLWTALMVCVYGFVSMNVFMDLCMDVFGCVSGYVYGFVRMCLWLCVWICMDVFLAMCYGYVYGYRVLILHETRFNKYRGLPLLGARFHHHWDLLLHEAHSNNILGLTPLRDPFQ